METGIQTTGKMSEQEKKNQIVYLLQEGMYSIADRLIEEYGMNMAEAYQQAFPGLTRAPSRVEDR